MNLIATLLFCLPLISITVNASKWKLKIDKEHLKLDFLDIFGSWSTIFSDAEMDFRYFAAHDYDNNKKLDGLELFTALGHDSQHEDESQSEKDHSAPEDIEKQVDDIFQEHDSNNDGFLNYKEFLSVGRAYPDISGEKKSGDRKLTAQEL
ncbi:uncharacterized protein TNIN_184341 [Trichonephila inaurata madagascariensis]|uniref:EF-hand domain-containing protein n=1 Tax=Trichonephila inaurata madagascariensis TaxID=2747483 RepID=A0A8X6YT55_9ARAC|nr:uncharacterized protein TNIN_184341 [Trichonephila inaurata madagascariensis]